MTSVSPPIRREPLECGGYAAAFPIATAPSAFSSREAYPRITPRAQSFGVAHIEERSFVAKNAPLDDGQKRVSANLDA
jgi:hypothetical protein